jgi:nucleotide-binding universal stress UspA family protein
MAGPVIAGVDESIPARAAARYAAGFASRHGLKLELLRAFTWPVIYPPLIPDAEAPDIGPRVKARQLLEKTAAELQEQHAHLPVTLNVVDGAATGVLVDASRRASYLIVAHRGSGGLAGMVAGSVAVHCTTHSQSPVVVVRGVTARADAPVIVGVDGSPGARAAARLAFQEARVRTVDLVAALSWPPARAWPEAEKAAGMPDHPAAVDPLAVSLAKIVDDFPDVKVHTEVRSRGGAPEMLTALATEIGAGLLVVGSRGVGGFRGLMLGSTSRALVNHAPCPVLVVPTDVARS